MRIIRSTRWVLWALMLPLIPVSQAKAGVFISVGFAPPVLPVYVQPPCPEPDLMWAPGYWAYGDEGYYWVPGAWVPAPYEGALWTPPYWGWQEGLYVFHPGYWGREVGYYGGVHYGFGYMGIGFVGGRWHERHFEYNTAIVRVNETHIHTTYIDRTVIREHEVVRDSRVAYAGGPGGIRHDPTPDERRAMQTQHIAPTRYQEQHMQQARSDRSNFFNVNHGHPQNVAVARPLAPERHEAPAPAGAAPLGVGARGGPVGRPETMNRNSANENRGFRGGPTQGVSGTVHGVETGPAAGRPESPSNQRQAPANREQGQQNQARPTPYGSQPQQHPGPANPGNRQPYETRPVQPGYQVQQPRSNPEMRPQPQEPPRYQQSPSQQRPALEPRYQQPQVQQRPSPEPRYQQPQVQQRPSSEPRYQQPQVKQRPAPEPRYQQQQRPAQELRPAPQPRQQSRPSPEPHHEARPQHEPKR